MEADPDIIIDPNEQKLKHKAWIVSLRFLNRTRRRNSSVCTGYLQYFWCWLIESFLVEHFPKRCHLVRPCYEDTPIRHARKLPCKSQEQNIWACSPVFLALLQDNLVKWSTHTGVGQHIFDRWTLMGSNGSTGNRIKKCRNHSTFAYWNGPARN